MIRASASHLRRGLAFGYMMLMANVAGAQSPFPSSVLPDKPTRVSDNVHEIVGFPNVVIVTGERATLVVDTGLGTRNGATAARVAKQLSKGSILYLTTTHFHPEHAAGESGFPPNTILVRSSVQQNEMKQNGVMMLEMFRKMSPQWAEDLSGVSSLRTPDVTFENDMTLDLGGGVTARVFWLGAAHTKGDQLVLVQPDNVLISGDVVQKDTVPGTTVESGGFASWLAVLEKLEPLKPRLVVPTHSEPGDGSLIARERMFIEDMRTRAIALKHQGVSAPDATKQLTEVLKTSYPGYANRQDWPNLSSMGRLVQQLYAEDR